MEVHAQRIFAKLGLADHEQVNRRVVSTLTFLGLRIGPSGPSPAPPDSSFPTVRGVPDGAPRPGGPARPRPARSSPKALLPYERGDLINRLHQHGEIDSMEHTADGTIVAGRANADLAGGCTYAV